MQRFNPHFFVAQLQQVLQLLTALAERFVAECRVVLSECRDALAEPVQSARTNLWPPRQLLTTLSRQAPKQVAIAVATTTLLAVALPVLAFNLGAGSPDSMMSDSVATAVKPAHTNIVSHSEQSATVNLDDLTLRHPGQFIRPPWHPTPTPKTVVKKPVQKTQPHKPVVKHPAPPKPVAKPKLKPVPMPPTISSLHEPHGILRQHFHGDGYLFGQCTDGAFMLAHHTMLQMGNAGDWDNTARARGYPTGYIPKVGATVVFERGVMSSPLFGHVAHVVAVSGSRFEIEEMNGTAGPFRWDFRWVTMQRGISFIYW